MAAEGHHGEGDECFGGAESERDVGQEPEFGQLAHSAPRSLIGHPTSRRSSMESIPRYSPCSRQSTALPPSPGIARKAVTVTN